MLSAVGKQAIAQRTLPYQAYGKDNSIYK